VDFRLSLYEKQAKVRCRHREKADEAERTDYLKIIARMTYHIPNKGQVTVRYYGL